MVDKKSKCPYCKKEMKNCDEILIKEVRESTILMECENCELLFGRHT